MSRRYRVQPRSIAFIRIKLSEAVLAGIGDGRWEVRKSLERDVPWLRALWSYRLGEDRVARFMAEPMNLDGAALQVVEFTGKPGDVIAMHPWMLHAPALNCGIQNGGER